MNEIPFLDILYTLTYLALIAGCVSLLMKGEFKPFIRLAGYGLGVLAVEIIVVGWMLNHWSFGKLIERYVTHGFLLIPYLIKEYF